MRLILSFFCWLVLTSAAVANPITVHVPYSKTGNAQAVTRLILDGLEKRGWKFDERTTANPQLSNETFNASSKPMLLLWGTDLVPSRAHPTYRAAPKAQDLVTITYVIPRYICAVGNITARDYADRNRVLNVAAVISPADEQYLLALNQHLGTRHRVIKYTNSREIEAAVAAQEVNIVMTSVGLRLQQQGLVQCLFNTGQSRVGTVPLVTDLYPHMTPKNFASVYYLLARGLAPADLARLRSDVVAVQKEYTPYTAYLERNQNPTTPLNADDQLHLIAEFYRNIP